MPQQEILKETPILMAELKESLDKIKKKEKELNFRASRTHEYLKTFCKLKSKEAKELYEKIEALKVPRLKDIHITKIVDLLPKTPEQLKVLLQGYTLTVNNENVKRIVEVVNQFCSETK